MKKINLGQIDLDGSFQDLIAKGEAFAKSYGEAMNTLLMQGLKNAAVVSIIHSIAATDAQSLTDQQCRAKLATIEGATNMMLHIFGMNAVLTPTPELEATYEDEPSAQTGEDHAATAASH